MKIKKFILFLVLPFTIIGVFSSLMFPQETTGNLKGKVVLKEDNSPLPDISITIESPSLMGIKTTISDAKGYYRFSYLPPGVYKVKAKAPGFKTIVREGIIINAGKTTTLNFFMEKGVVKETVVVVGKSPMLDLEKSGFSLNIKSEVLQTLPMPRNFHQVVQLAPGINTTSDNPSVHGESNWNNQYLVDGVDATDPFYGFSGTTLNFDIIEEVEIKTSGLSAEYGQVMGAIVNVITKSGGNKFSGGINFYLSDPSLTGENVPEEEKEAHPVKTYLRDYSLSLGGPLLKDKAWFFASFQYLKRIRQRDDVDYDSKKEMYRWMGKISIQPLTNHKIILFGWGDPYDEYGGMLDPFWAYETNPRVYGGGKFNLAGTWYWTISKNAFLETRISRFSLEENFEPTQDDSIPHYYDMVTGHRWGNYVFHYLSNRARFKIDSDLTYFLNDFLGNHEIKTGLEYSYSYERKKIWTVHGGDSYYIYFAGMPYMLIRKMGKEDCKARSNRFTFYIQDSWGITDRLILNLGTRFDYIKGKNDVLEVIQDYKTISPRLGFVYTLTPDNKTILKANYGRFHENPILYFPDVFRKGKTPYQMLLFNPFTGEYDILLMEYGHPEARPFLNKLRSPYVNEFLLGIEREIFPDFSIGLTGIYRKTKDIIEDVEINMLYEDPNNPYVPTGSKDGTGRAILAVGNPEEAYREYKGIEISFTKRFSKNWMFLGSYTLSESKGTVQTTLTEYLDSPGTTVNRDGYLPTDRRHIIKLAGAYTFPFGINVGFRYVLLSGLPYTKYLIDPYLGYYAMYETPLGGKDPKTGKVRRYPTRHSLDLRVEKTFKVWKGFLGVYVDIFNIFNANTPISYYTQDNPLFEKVAERMSPINAKINIRYSF